MDSTRPDPIPNPAVNRLSLYLRQLEQLQRQQRDTISSRLLGESLGFTDAQVRKDLAYFGQFGRAGVGYLVGDLINELRRILGTDKTWNVLLLGAGNLGRALMAYKGFRSKGFQLAAVFDDDPDKIGRDHGGFIVQSLDRLAEVIAQKNIRLAMIAIPAEVAQGAADRLVAAGIRGLLNFAPVSLTVPPSVAVRSVDLAVQLEQLSFQVNVSPSEAM